MKRSFALLAMATLAACSSEIEVADGGGQTTAVGTTNSSAGSGSGGGTATTGNSGGASAGGSTSGGTLQGSSGTVTSEDTNVGFSVAFVGSNFESSSSKYLYVTLFDADQSANWSDICSSVTDLAIPGVGHFLQMGVSSSTAIGPGVYAIGSSGQSGALETGTSAGPGSNSAERGQITLTQVSPSGSVSGDFDVTLESGSEVSGTFANSVACP